MRKRCGWPFILLALILLTSCKQDDQSILIKGNPKIKIFFEDEIAFQETYGKYLTTKFENIEIEVVSPRSLLLGSGTDSFEKVLDFVKQEQPDIIITNLDQMPDWINANQLQSLDSYIKKSKFPIEKVAPVVAETMRMKGNGRIYGLPPTFTTQALFYNRDLFTKENVNFPVDGMTWSQVFDTAAKFGVNNIDQSIYGLYGYYRAPFDLLMQLSLAEGILFFQQDENRMTMDTDSWKNIIKQIVDVYKLGVIYQNDPNKDNLSDLFIKGKAAMTIQSSSYLLDYKQNKPNFNLDIVTQPVGSNNLAQTPNISMNHIFCMNARAENSEIAWEIIQLINSEQFAKMNMYSAFSTDLVSRIDVSDKYEEFRLNPFYQLLPTEYNVSDFYGDLPEGFFSELAVVINKEMKLAIDDKKSIELAISSIQEEGDRLLIQKKNDSSLDSQP